MTYADEVAAYAARKMIEDEESADFILEREVERHARTIGEAHLIRDRAMERYQAMKGE